MDAHVLSVDEYDAWSKTLQSHGGVVLGKRLPNPIPHQGIGPVASTCSQYEVIKLGTVAVMKQGIIQRTRAVASSEIDAQHLLRKYPAVLSIDFDPSSFIECGFVVSVIFKKLNIQRPFPLWFKILHIDPCVSIPEMVRVCHQRENREWSL